MKLKAILVLALAGAALWGLLLLAERGGYVEDAVAEQVARYAGGTLRIGGVDLSLFPAALSMQEVDLREGESADAGLSIDTVRIEGPLRSTSDGRRVPSRIEVGAPRLVLVERPDGTFAPLDLLKPWPVSDVVPAVEIDDASLELRGDGPLHRALERVLAPRDPWRIDGIVLRFSPQAPPAPDLLAFSGRLPLAPGIEAIARGRVARDGRIAAEVRAPDLAFGRGGGALRDVLAGDVTRVLAERVAQGTVTLGATIGGTLPGRVPDGPDAPDAPYAIDAAPPAFTVTADVAARGVSLEPVAAPLPDVRMRIESDGRILAVDDLRATWDEDALTGSASFDVAGVRAATTATTVQERVAALRGSAHVAGRALGFERTFAAAVQHPLVRDQVDSFAPRGTFDIDLDIAFEPGVEPRARWRLSPVRADASYVGRPSHHDDPDGEGFPYRLFDVQGEVTGDGRHFEIRGVNGTHRGGGRASVDGWVDAAPHGTEHGRATFSIRVRGDGVPVDRELRDALDAAVPGAGEVVDRFAPRGLVDVDITVARPVERPRARVSGRVDARGIDATFDGFPYAIEDLNGRVEIDGPTYWLRGLEARHGDATVAIDGTVVVPERQPGAPRGLAHMDEIGLDLEVVARGVAADDELLDVLERIAPAAADAWRALRPAGPFDAEVRIEKEPGRRGRFRALVHPRGLSLVPRWLPVPVEGVFGQVEFGDLHPGDPEDRRFYVVAEDVAGRAADAEVRFRGSVVGGVAGPLLVKTGPMTLSPALVAALATEAARIAGGETPISRFFARCAAGASPAGRVAFDLATTAAAPARALAGPWSVRFDDVVLAAPDGEPLADGAIGALLAALRGASGRADLDLAHGTMSFRDLNGRLAEEGATVSIGRLDVERDERLHITCSDLAIGPLALDGDVLQRLAPQIEPFMRAAGATGTVSARFDRWVHDGGGEAADASIPAFEGAIELLDGEVAGTARIAKLVARITGGAGNGRGGGFGGVSGTLQASGCALWGVPLDDLSALFEFGPSGLLVHDLTGRIAGGTLPGVDNYLRVESAPPRFEGRLTLHGAEIAELLATRAGDGDLAGRVSVEMAFRGSGNHVTGGSGTIRIEDGDLWSLPLFATLYHFSIGALLGNTEPPRFHEGTVRFELEESALRLDEVSLLSPVMTLKGQGLAGPSGIDVVLVPRMLDAEIPMLTSLLDAMKKRLISYRVYGPWQNPRVAYWNEALHGRTDADESVTHLPRLPPRLPPEWEEPW